MDAITPIIQEAIASMVGYFDTHHTIQEMDQKMLEGHELYGRLRDAYNALPLAKRSYPMSPEGELLSSMMRAITKFNCEIMRKKGLGFLV